MGVDWIALSFVQRPEDIFEASKLINGRAAIIAKLEKPSGVRNLLPIMEQADGVMVARGDLGVEMPPENVPRTQKLIVREARRMGKPVIVATQMLESMIFNATPTRAEASDVATAVYDGADAIMLSAESASGQYPVEAVTMMDRIARHTQEDPAYHTGIRAQHPDLQHTAADAITAAARQVAETIEAVAVVTYTTSGSTTLRMARERPEVPIMCLTSKLETARRMVLSFGVHTVHTPDVHNFGEMVQKAVQIARRDGIAHNRSAHRYYGGRSVRRAWQHEHLAYRRYSGAKRSEAVEVCGVRSKNFHGGGKRYPDTHGGIDPALRTHGAAVASAFERNHRQLGDRKQKRHQSGVRCDHAAEI